MQSLAALKAQLKLRLAEVENELKVREEMAKPKTLEEVETLEKKLAEALEELREMKKTRFGKSE